MSDFDPVEAGAEALWDEYRDHSEDPPWGDKELHARFEEAYRVNTRAVLAAALDRDELARVLYEAWRTRWNRWNRSGREFPTWDNLNQSSGDDWLADADTIRAWAGVTS